jgi:predicted ester cyclase
MSVEENKAVALRTMEQLDQRDLDGVRTNFATDATFHGWAPHSLNVDGHYAWMSALLTAFPDSRFPVKDVIAEGDRVAVRHRFEGTHEREFQGIPSTSRHVGIDGIVIFRHNEHGQVAEAWLNADIMGLMQQIGVIPAPDGTPA